MVIWLEWKWETYWENCVCIGNEALLVPRLWVYSGWLCRERMETMVEEKTECLQDPPWRLSPVKPHGLKPSLRKASWLNVLSRYYFNRAFQKVQPWITIAIGDACPQTDRRMSSGPLHCPKTPSATPPPQSQWQEMTCFIRRKGGVANNCPESDGMIFFMTFPGLNSHNVLSSL